MKEKTKIAIFASGAGSNAQAIIDHSFRANYSVALIVTNNENAGVLRFSDEYDIDALVIDRNTFYEDTVIVSFLKEQAIDVLVLAGFLWKIPDYLLDAFPNKIINIHPSLLPKYGGKGMYGINVHKAVFQAKETRSGITIHIVNNEYDKGTILLQKEISIAEEKSADDIAKKVLQLEHTYFPLTIEKFVKNLE
jgi:phosphoribosylglycinamide formyltransferase-1